MVILSVLVILFNECPGMQRNKTPESNTQICNFNTFLKCPHNSYTNTIRMPRSQQNQNVKTDNILKTHKIKGRKHHRMQN